MKIKSILADNQDLKDIPEAKKVGDILIKTFFEEPDVLPKKLL